MAGRKGYVDLGPDSYDPLKCGMTLRGHPSVIAETKQ